MNSMQLSTPATIDKVAEKDLRENTAEPLPIEMLLAQAGHKILKDELQSDWLSLTQVSRVCQKHKLKWPLNTHKASVLEPLIREYFEARDALKFDGVKVRFRTDRDENYREVVLLKFYKHDLANDGPIRKLADERSGL